MTRREYAARSGATLCVLVVVGGAALSMADGVGRSRAAEARLFFLDITGGRVLSARPDGSDLKVLLAGHRTSPDGIDVDAKAGHIYWTNMGAAAADDGSVERMDLDGKNLTIVVPPGGTFTAKQLTLDTKNGKLYWSDREGMRVMRSNLDGSGLETLLETARGDAARRDARNWCVGIAVDAERGKIYWTQKGAAMPAREAFDGRTSKCPRARTWLIARMSRCSSTVCPSRSISTWT